MKRTRSVKLVTEEPKNVNDQVQWHNTGGGSFRLGRRIIKPGEKFYATENEISQGFRDVLKRSGGTPPLTKKDQEKTQKVIPGVKPTFTIVKREAPSKSGNDLYDVVSDVSVVKDGEKVNVKKPLNTKGLSKEKAEQLLKALSE